MAINREEVLQAAEKFVQRGKIEAAIKEYAKVVGEAPTDHNTLNKIGDLYQRQNRLGDAVRYWIQAADVLKSDGFNVRAIAMYKKILRNDATRLDAIESLAELLHKERLVNEARTQYQVLSDYYLKHDRTSSAISVLQKMAELEPENPSHHVKLAELFVKQKLPDKALGEYRIIAQTMNFGTYDDILALEDAVGRDRLVEIMRRAQPGWLSDRSWEFWRGRLSYANGAEIAARPPRRAFLDEDV